MKFKSKEKSKMDSRRKMWSLFGWNWAYKRTNGGHYKTEYTSDETECKGYGFFKKNHSLSCTDHAICRMRLAEKRRCRKIERQKRKQELRDLKKVINYQNELE